MPIITNFLAFFQFFPKIFPSWIRIRILNADPDPGGTMNADPCGSGSTALQSRFRAKHLTQRIQ